MSFRCEQCGAVRPSNDFPGEAMPTRAVLQMKRYHDTGRVDIATEKLVCSACFARLPKEPEVLVSPKKDPSPPGCHRGGGDQELR
jgi:hypothetical protein